MDLVRYGKSNEIGLSLNLIFLAQLNGSIQGYSVM
jgi:hypothetical protein